MSTATIPTDTDQVAEIMDRIKAWPATLRIALAKGILDTLDASKAAVASPAPAGASPRGVPSASAVGLLKTDREPPDDEECRRIVEEERWKKYG